MILVDSSWIELLRDRRRAHSALRELAIADPASIATCEPIAVELLADRPGHREEVQDQLGTLDDLALDPAQPKCPASRRPFGTENAPCLVESGLVPRTAVVTSSAAR